MNSNQFENELRLSQQFLARLEDETFATAFYCALENQAWGGDGKQVTTYSFRSAGELVAELRDCGECYLDWYCRWGWSCTVQSMVAEELAKLGWYPVEYPND